MAAKKERPVLITGLITEAVEGLNPLMKKYFIGKALEAEQMILEAITIERKRSNE